MKLDARKVLDRSKKAFGKKRALENNIRRLL